MGTRELAAGNAAGTLGFEQAAEVAYLLASRWGGAFAVHASPRGGHCALGAGASPPPGFAEVGRAVSVGAGDLSWAWADGRASYPPASPFDGLPQPMSHRLVAHLAPDTRILAGLVDDMSEARRALAGGRPQAAARILLGSGAFPTPRAESRPVPSPAYLAVAEQRGMVASETERLKSCLAAAAQAYSLRDGGDAAAAFLTGRAAPAPKGEPGPKR